MHFHLFTNILRSISQNHVILCFLLEQGSKTTVISLAYLRTKNAATASLRPMRAKDAAETCGIVWSMRYPVFGDLPVIWQFFSSKLLVFPVLAVRFQDLGACWSLGTVLWKALPSWSRICQKMFVLWYLWNVDNLKGSRTVLPASVF